MAGMWILILGIVALVSWAWAGKVNVALRKPASTTSGQLPSWSPENAVDGNSNINGEWRTCFHAARSPSDWTVDLGQQYQLYDIRVYLRNGFEVRTANSIIYLDNNPSHVCYNFTPTISDNPTNGMCNGTARNVTIRNPGRGPGYDHSLNICEVEIYVCSIETYGRDCDTPCGHCADPPCDRWAGVCNGSCKTGWRGPRCNTACDSTTYGINCHKKCADRKCTDNTVSCNRFNGSCETRCSPGWMGSDCTEKCGNNTYGINCTRLCSDRKCNGNSSCDHVNGSCENGCAAGWEGVDCRQECDDEHYGPGCNGVCATRHCEGISSCNRSTGLCDGGCQTGWAGTDCTGCDEEHYGIDCTNVCSDRHCDENSTCNPPSGQCIRGCQTGWEGSDCTVTASTPPKPPVPVIVGAVAGIVLLVLILVLVFVLIRRRRVKKNNQHGVKPSTLVRNEKLEKDPVDVYVNGGFEDEKKEAAVSHFAPIQVKSRQRGEEDHSNADSKSVDTQEDEEDYDVDSLSINRQEGPEPPERNYYNLGDERRGHVIPVSQLEVRVKELEDRPEMSEEEYKQLPDNFLHPYDESQKPVNKGKNRYKGYYPYNYNRVVLHSNSDNSKGDYINASYLDGYNTKKRYIAAQGPYKSGLIDDFWRMIWQEECKVVIMVTQLVEGGKVKCLRYWPEEGNLTYGDITVSMETVTKLADYTITKLSVQHEKESKRRHVTHFHFTSWSDHGVPDTSCLLNYMWRINETSGQQKNPIVVHCSAGIGRTGTYIAVESLVSQATTERSVDVVGFVSNMRGQRKNMIQTKEQYHFIYRAAAAAVVEGDTSLDADVIRKIDLSRVTNVTMGNKTVQQHFEALANFPEERTTSDVTKIPSYRCRTGFFVITSRPDKEEVWNQIYNTDSRTLISWENNDENYLPTSTKPVTTSRLTASELTSTVISDCATVSTLELKEKDDNDGSTIHHYHVTGNMRDPGVSVLIDSLLQWTGQSECQSTTIVSHSLNDTRLLILLVNITSRLQDDGKVDIISNMRRLQEQLGGPHFTVDEVRLCLEFAQNCLESLGMYANM